MTLVQLEYIISLDKYRHFVTAADKCFVTQPTLSMQIQKLEEELGVKIFDRSKIPVEPTQIGKKIINQAKSVLDSASKLLELIQEEKNEIKGELKIGIIPTIAQYLIPLFITQTLVEYPDLQIQIDELLTNQVIKALNDNEIDIGIIATPLNIPGIREIPVFYEPFVVFTSQNNQLYNKQSIEPTDLSTDDIWLLNEGHCFSNQAINLCRMNKKYSNKLALKYKNGSLESLIKLVEMQFGYTLLPYLALLEMPEQRKQFVRHFSEPVPVREISIIVKDSFIKEKMLSLIKNKIMEHIPKELLNIGNHMLVNWK